MEDREEIWQGSSNVLVVPVEYSIQHQEQYPEKMSEHLQQAENVQHREQDDRDADEIIARGKHHSPAELQKGLTVFTAAVFIIGEMAGSGVLALPAAIVGAGWTGFGMLVVCCFASGYCGTVLGRSWSILRERHDEYKVLIDSIFVAYMKYRIFSIKRRTPIKRRPRLGRRVKTANF